MVRWLRDASGRFPRRPHYEVAELESICADLFLELRQQRRQPESYPITVDDLAVLVERHAADLDLYAELAPDLDGVTDFTRGAKPRVRISARLSSNARSHNRLRSTLAHELAHVVLHNFIWWFDPGVAFDPQSLSPKCVLRIVSGDWMEWQANYCAGALLVPATAVPSLQNPVWERSATARTLIRAVQTRFDVSAQLGTIRLRQLGHLTTRPRRIARAPIPKLW